MLPNAFPEPQSLNILEIGNGKDMRTMVYSVEKPHPGYMKDPNILNEMGHTVYPKMVYPNGRDHPGTVVNNAKEEEELMGQAGNQLVQQLDTSIEDMERRLAEMKANKERLEANAVKQASEPSKSNW